MQGLSPQAKFFVLDAAHLSAIERPEEFASAPKRVVTAEEGDNGRIGILVLLIETDHTLEQNTAHVIVPIPRPVADDPI